MGARYGQHFLVDAAVVSRILSDCPRNAPIIEVGPGAGALTHGLLAMQLPLLLIEIDPRWYGHWHGKCAEYPQMQVWSRDVLSVRWDEIAAWHPGPYTIISNLPYEISGPFLVRLAQSFRLWQKAVLMLQEEIVLKILARPGDRLYGRLSIQVQRYCDVEAGQHVPPSAFKPPPRVQSQCVLLYPKREVLSVASESMWNQMLTEAFTHRRQMMRRIFKSYGVDWAHVGIEPTARPEELDLPAWGRLCDALSRAVPETGFEPATY